MYIHSIITMMIIPKIFSFGFSYDKNWRVRLNVKLIIYVLYRSKIQYTLFRIINDIIFLAHAPLFTIHSNKLIFIFTYLIKSLNIICLNLSIKKITFLQKLVYIYICILHNVSTSLNTTYYTIQI